MKKIKGNKEGGSTSDFPPTSKPIMKKTSKLVYLR